MPGIVLYAGLVRDPGLQGTWHMQTIDYEEWNGVSGTHREGHRVY